MAESEATGDSMYKCVYCRISRFNGAQSRLEKHVFHCGEADSTDCQPDCGSQNVTFSVVASVDARTLLLVMLQSNHVCLVVGDLLDSQHDNDSSSSIDISFEQLMIRLAQLQRMLVSTVTVYESITLIVHYCSNLYFNVFL